MSLVNTKHPAFITVGIKKPPCYIHKPPPSKKEEFSIYFYMFPHLAVIWISGYVVAHTMVCTDPLHLSSTLLLQMSSSVCGGGRFCTFHQATNTCGSTDAVFRVGWWDNLRRLPGEKKTPSFNSFTASFMTQDKCCQKKKSLPTSNPMGPAPFHGSWCTSWVSSDRSRSSPAVHPATYLPTTIQLCSSGEPETPSGWRCLNPLFSNGYLKLDVADG